MLNIAFIRLSFTKVFFSKVIYELIETGPLFLVAFYSEDYLLLTYYSPVLLIYTP